MKFGLPQRLIAVGALCAASLIGLVIVEGRARAGGTEVILPMRPVDPRAILSGHYVQLSFDQVVPADGACPPQDVGYGENAWIALRREGDRHVVTAVLKDRAAAEQKGEIVLRGAAMCSEPTPRAGNVDGVDGNLTLRLAVERFHTDQDEALAIERAVRDRTGGEARVFAVLSVDKAGTPRTKGVIVDGERVELSWF
jgi:uncharacterized membrane-anchored protein